MRGGDAPFDIPIYTLCRRWVRNDPYNNEAPVADPPVSFDSTFLTWQVGYVESTLMHLFATSRQHSQKEDKSSRRAL